MVTKSIFLTFDIVSDTIFGGERLKLHCVIPNEMKRVGDTISYDFFHDECVDLAVKKFAKISLTICDATSGELLKDEYREIPARLQLEFTKTF